MRFSLDSSMEEQQDHINHDDDDMDAEVPLLSPSRTSMLVTTRRHRPSSRNMTPDAKRHRVLLLLDHDRLSSLVAYPSKIPVPPKSTIAALYDSAVLQASSSDNNVSTSTSTTGAGDDQVYLKPAGILSLEQVLLPALGIQEEKALKRVQSKVQRDAPEYKLAMEACRRLVRQSVAKAIQAAEQSRMERCQHQQELRQHVSEQRRLQREARAARAALVLQEQREARAHERQRQKELEEVEKKERMRALARQYPRNQELWKEVFFLTSSITQLEKEERMWIQAEQDLIQSASSSNTTTTENDSTTPTTTTTMQDCPEPEVVQAPKDPLQEKAEQSFQDIVLASTRIQQGLGIVLNIMEESEQVRKEMYRKYRQDHQFHGYHGVRNPKGLIRFLSQED